MGANFSPLQALATIRRLALLGLALVVIAETSACDRHQSLAMAQVAQSGGAALRVEQAHGTLAREHSVTIEVAESALRSSFQRITDRCTADSAHHCTVLQSDVTRGQFPSGQIRLRIDPSAVADLIGFAQGLGRLEHQSTRVEDLADAIQDSQARIEMLTTYRKQLLELQGKAGSNIDAAIKVAAELSTVQSNLEQANGQAAYQIKRTTTDIVSIYLSVAGQKAFGRPIRDALHDFFGNLSTGISEAITAVAYILPWLLVVIPVLYLLRFLWRRRGKQ
jgi:Domain of unknown function (DUF4349)